VRGDAAELELDELLEELFGLVDASVLDLLQVRDGRAKAAVVGEVADALEDVDRGLDLSRAWFVCGLHGFLPCAGVGWCCAGSLYYACPGRARK